MKLKAIVLKKISVLEKSELNIENYNLASWPYLQADSKGATRALKNIAALLEFVKEMK